MVVNDPLRMTTEWLKDHNETEALIERAKKYDTLARQCRDWGDEERYSHFRWQAFEAREAARLTE